MNNQLTLVPWNSLAPSTLPPRGGERRRGLRLRRRGGVMLIWMKELDTLHEKKKRPLNYLLLLLSLLLEGETDLRLGRRSGESRREVLRRGGERERLRETRTSRLGDLDLLIERERERLGLSSPVSVFKGLS